MADCRGILFDRPVPYSEGVRIQEKLLAARTAGSISDTVLFLEHTPVITLGTRGRDNFLKITPEILEERGIDFVRASRGGDVTYHGPGQLVMYPILKLGSHEADAHGYLHNLEEIALRVTRSFGVEAFRREGMSGAWTPEGKIAAIGFRLKRWITCHGMSYNINLDLAGFDAIVPCGLIGEPVTSLQRILGPACPDSVDVRARMADHFSDVCGRALEQFSFGDSMPEDLSSLLSGV